MRQIFDDYLKSWKLTPDGEAITTPSSDLLPVRYAGTPAFLKIAREAEERRGGHLMFWWNGEGAARVLAHDGQAILLERAPNKMSLAEMAKSGRDDEASGIICQVAAKLHVPRPGTHPQLIPLNVWFQELEPALLRYGGLFNQAAAAARELLQAPHDVVILHGDLHHRNVLDGGSRGWLAIDPKGLIGERGFDFANIFCNPTLAHAASPGRVAQQATEIARLANLDRDRLLKWVLAYAGLSAAWSLDTHGAEAAGSLVVAQIAAGQLAIA